MRTPQALFEIRQPNHNELYGRERTYTIMPLIFRPICDEQYRYVYMWILKYQRLCDGRGCYDEEPSLSMHVRTPPCYASHH